LNKPQPSFASLLRLWGCYYFYNRLYSLLVWTFRFYWTSFKRSKVHR